MIRLVICLALISAVNGPRADDEEFTFQIPPYEGDRYEDTIPDTLDLAIMAERAVNGLTGPLDPKEEYRLYFVADWFRNPPVLWHEEGSDECQAKFMGPLVLNRIITGSSLHLDIERAVIRRYLDDVDGRIVHTDGSSSRILEAMMIYWLRDHNPMWKKLSERALGEWISGMTDKGDWAFFKNGEGIPTGFDAMDGWRAEMFTLAARILKSSDAREWGGKYIRYLRDHAEIFDAEGRFIGDTERMGKRAEKGGHFHNHTTCLLAFIDYALLTGDPDLIAFVEKSYLWARSSEAGSSALIGFFPEFVGRRYPNSEGCAIADMVTLALKLSANGIGDYWDDADQWLRNHFAEAQLTKEKGASLDAFARTQEKKPVGPGESAEDVSQRNIGAFAGWPGVNEWALRVGIQHCCTANGARAIYHAWKNILHVDNKTLRVNLLLNRASTDVDIHSHLPYSGRVDLVFKSAFERVLLRMPKWVDTKNEALTCTVNKKSRPLHWSGRYVDAGPANQGDVLTLTFPMKERTVRETICGQSYEFMVRGNTVTTLKPGGEHCPLYERTVYRSGSAPLKKVLRFASSETGIMD